MEVWVFPRGFTQFYHFFKHVEKTPLKSCISTHNQHPEVLTQALRQGAIPGTVPLTGDGAGAQQVVARVTAVRHSSLETVPVRPAGQYLPDAVLNMSRLCAIHNLRK